MSGTPTGTLTAKIIYDVDSAMAGMVQLGQITDKEGKRMVRQVAEINDIFKTLSRSQGAAAQAVQQTQQQMAAAGNSAKQTAWAMRTVPAQITDVFTQLAGGANPMMVLIQQGGQLKDVFGGFGPMFAGLASYFTAAKIAIGGVAGVVGLLGFEFYQAEKRAKEFQNGLLLTGNYAGMTASRLSSMAAALSAATSTTKGDATDSISAVVGSGQFGPQNVQAVAEATVRLQRITGDSAQSIVKDFASMTDGVAKWGAEQNKSGKLMNFLTTAQYEQIKSLEDAGKTTEAVTVLMAAYNGRLREHGSQVSGLAKFWLDAKVAFQEYAEAQSRAFKTSTVDSELKRLKEQESVLQADLKRTAPENGGGLIDAFFNNRTKAALADTRNAIGALERSKALADQVTGATADFNRRQQEGTASRQWIDKLNDGARGAANLARELANAELHFKRLAAAGTPASDADKAAAIAAIRKKFEEKPAAPKAPEGPSPYLRLLSDLTKYREQSDLMAATNGRVAESDNWAAQMRDRLRDSTVKMSDAQEKALSAAIAAQAELRKAVEQDATARRDRMDAIAAEVAEGEKQQAMIDGLIGAYNEFYVSIHQQGEEIGKTARELEHLNAMRKIDADFQAKSRGANADTIVRLQQERDKAKAEIASALRNKAQAEDAFKADPKNGERAALEAFVKDAADIAKFTQNIVQGSLDRAADAFINFAKTGKLALGDLFGFMAEEYLRQMFRMQAADMIKGGGFSLSGMLGSALSWAGSLFTPHATGLNYVPYDGYPALLHEGERVLTKNEARGDRGSSAQAITQVFHIGQGVTPAQVQMAMTKAREEGAKLAEGRILQSMRRQGAFSQ